MANEPTTAEPRSLSTEIRFSSASLTATIPTWISTAELDSCFPHGFGAPLPAGAGTALREAAAQHQLALAGCSSAERQAILLGLRSGTIVRREGVGEAEASLNLLRVHLEDVPLDILQAACHAYCNVPGQRFFPRSAGELRSFINPMLFERKARAFRLRWLADQADQEDAERERLAADPLTPDVCAAIRAEHGLPPAPAPAPRAGMAPLTDGLLDRLGPQASRKSIPGVEDYRALGLNEDEALEQWQGHIQQIQKHDAEKAPARAAQQRRAA